MIGGGFRGTLGMVAGGASNANVPSAAEEQPTEMAPHDIPTTCSAFADGQVLAGRQKVGGTWMAVSPAGVPVHCGAPTQQDLIEAGVNPPEPGELPKPTHDTAPTNFENPDADPSWANRE